MRHSVEADIAVIAAIQIHLDDMLDIHDVIGNPRCRDQEASSVRGSHCPSALIDAHLVHLRQTLMIFFLRSAYFDLTFDTPSMKPATYILNPRCRALDIFPPLRKILIYGSSLIDGISIDDGFHSAEDLRSERLVAG